jgi:hypothetical protein
MNRWLLALGIVLGLATTAATVEAHGFIGVGVNIGFPVYPRPYCGPYYYPYYRPYPVYVGPAVYVAPPPPVVIEQPPVYVPAAVVRTTPTPGTPSSPYQEPPIAQRPQDVKQADISRHLPLLNDADERTRSDAAMDLGRLKAQSAIDVLCSVLTNDKSALVRESAARALGLIASPRALGALQNAAQVDNDRDVRRSAQFSAEVIRANLR